jgi:hypothetical protein
MAPSSGSLPREDTDGLTDLSAAQDDSSGPARSSRIPAKRKSESGTQKRGGGSKKQKPTNAEEDDSKSNDPKGNELDLTLPPIDNVYDAFDHMMNRVMDNKDGVYPDLKQLADDGGFTCNVVTMCSGTEAPIFSLRLIQNAFFHNTGFELFRFKHLFSVEIEPFKQGYIRRNTDAPVFRDVRDFCDPDVKKV